MLHMQLYFDRFVVASQAEDSGQDEEEQEESKETTSVFQEIKDLIHTRQIKLIEESSTKQLAEDDIFSAFVDQLINTDLNALEEHFSAFIREWINSGCVQK